MPTSQDAGMKGVTTAEVPETSVTIASTWASTIKVTEVPPGRVLKGAKSWEELRNVQLVAW